MLDFKQVKEAHDILSVAQRLGLQLKQSGEQYRSMCPKCQGGPRDLVITPSKGLHFCFNAKKGGDQIALVAHIKGTDQKAAAEWIAGTVPVPGTVPQEQKGRTNCPTLAYLESTNEDVQKFGISVETCEHFGAGYAPKGIMRGRLAIPVHDRQGNLLAYCGRALKGESPTLSWPNGFDPTGIIFNAHRVTCGELYLVRDPLSVLMAHSAGVENTACFLTDGMSALQLQQLAAFLDESGIENVLLL